MKIFGYTKKPSELEELDEVTFSGSPKELREMANFLSEMAHKLENDQEEFGHAHIKDFVNGWADSELYPDVIVFKENS